jgi:hypothetical protein
MTTAYRPGARVAHFAEPACLGSVTVAELGTILVVWDNGNEQRLTAEAVTPAPAEPYPSPADISYDEDSRWCQDHGHTGLLTGSMCVTCDRLAATDRRFAAVLGTVHNPDGSRRTA